MYPHTTPPQPGWSFEYVTTNPHHAHFSHFVSPRASPRGSAHRHSRKASHTAAKESGGWHSAHPSQSFAYDSMPEYATPPRKQHEHVSASFGGMKFKTAQRRFSMSGEERLFARGYDESRPSRSHKRPTIVVDDAHGAPRCVFREPDPQRDRGFSHSSPRKPKSPTDQYVCCDQVPIYDETDSPKRSRARRASTSTPRTPQKPKPSAAFKTPPKATEEDAVRAGIPPGYSIKNWDPTEAPIILLGSVFDANSLGKWIYDWTVFYHGASTPMAEVAGDLWLLLIKLAGNVKRADECIDRIRNPEAREVVEDFLESGKRLWTRFKKLLKACEQFMWKAARRDGNKTVSMGRNAGCEFVESLFGRDRELENTEKLMHSIRLWSMRFDANCDDILKRPSAA